MIGEVKQQEHLNLKMLPKIAVRDFNVSAFNPTENVTVLPIDMGSSRFRALIAGFLSFTVSSISSAGKLGGGGLYVPILSLVGGLDMKTSASVSSFMVVGSTMANAIYNMPLRHPEFGNKPLIDYDLVLLSEPCLLLGVRLGVICNLSFPDWLTTVLFVCFLGSSSFTRCKAGLRRWKQEKDEDYGLETKDGGRNRSLKRTLQRNALRGCILPWRKLGILALIWVSFFGLQVLRGDTRGQKKSCRADYWLLFRYQIPLSVFFTLYILLMERTSVNDPCLGQDQMDDDRVDRKVLLFPLMAVTSGYLSGLFGVAGGMIISPILLQIGIHPQVAAATTAFMVWFSASMFAVQYLLLFVKLIPYGLIFATVCFISSWFGLQVIMKPIRRHGWSSVIVFLVAIVTTVSTVLITSFGTRKIWRQYVEGKHMGFRLPC